MYSGNQACCAAKGFSIFTYEASNTAVVILELIMTSQKKKEVYLLLYEEGLKQVVGIFYQVIMSHNDDNGLILGYTLLHHLSAHWARRVHHVSTLVPKQHLQPHVSTEINIE
jgi:hypothetical protein